jgi:hypothetical protein
MAPARAPQPTRGGSCCRACETRPPAVSIDRRPRGPPRRHPDRWRARTTGARRRHCSADADVDTWWCGSRRPCLVGQRCYLAVKNVRVASLCLFPCCGISAHAQAGRDARVRDLWVNYVRRVSDLGASCIWLTLKNIADTNFLHAHTLPVLVVVGRGKSSGRTDLPRRSRTVLPRNQPTDGMALGKDVCMCIVDSLAPSTVVALAGFTTTHAVQLLL